MGLYLLIFRKSLLFIFIFVTVLFPVPEHYMYLYAKSTTLDILANFQGQVTSTLQTELTYNSNKTQEASMGS